MLALGASKRKVFHQRTSLDKDRVGTVCARDQREANLAEWRSGATGPVGGELVSQSVEGDSQSLAGLALPGYGGATESQAGQALQGTKAKAQWSRGVWKSL